MTLCLLTITSAASMEEVLVDWFLERDSVTDFHSMPVFGHGSDEKNMSFSERVTGRAKKTMFQLHLTVAAAEKILQELKKEFAGMEIHYMISPLTRSGDLSTYEK